jgi:Ca2+-binding EF-hand superfamily protein
MLICDCDEFTRQYYKTKYGTEFEAIKVDRPCLPGPEREVPPYNGFGSYEDSLGNCDSLVPKPPKRDFMKFMEKDRNGLEGNTLRFAAVLVSKNKVDKDRRFIIASYLSDETISIFEPLRHNSGITPGKFIERARQEKPGQPKYSSQTPDFYTSKDLVVGAKIVVQDFPFILVDADEYTYNYMEKHSNEWPTSNIDFVLYKLKGLLGNKTHGEAASVFQAVDKNGAGNVTFENFRDIIGQSCGSMMSEAEVITLARYYGARASFGIPTEVLRAAIQESLRKANFENFDELCKALKLRDQERRGLLHAADIRKTCLAMHINIPVDLLSHYISRLADATGHASYEEFLANVNWRDHPMPISTNIPAVLRFDAEWRGASEDDVVKKVNYSSLLADIFGNAA